MPIDLWDVRTFDPCLLGTLEESADLICRYLATENEIVQSYDLSNDPKRPIERPKNCYAIAFSEFCETMTHHMMARTIRAFHYTRLTEEEVASLRQHGVHISTPQTLRGRLNELVGLGRLTKDIADQLYKESPFHSDQLEGRLGKFWMASHPVPIEDSGVMPLMEHWGGEVASMWVRRVDVLAAPLKIIGRPRVVEIAAPLDATQQSHLAGKAVIATFGHTLDAAVRKSAFDLYVNLALPPDAVLAVHTEGDATFSSMGQTYPAGYIDIDLALWNELTGEDD